MTSNSNPAPGAVSRPARPWDGAARKLGIIPSQAILYPRPVILMCRQCAIEAYWYPKEDTIELYSNHCERYVEGGHSWYVLSWNLNEPVETGETP